MIEHLSLIVVADTPGNVYEKGEVMSEFWETLMKTRPDICEDAQLYVDRIKQGKIKKKKLPNSSENYPVDIAGASFIRLVHQLKDENIININVGKNTGG
jgi:hypothetical protein